MANYALVVGINEYPALSGLGPLKGAVADACDFAEWVIDPDGGAVTPDKLFFWVHPWPAALTAALADALAAGATRWDNPLTDWAMPDRTRAPTAAEIINTLERTGRALRAAAFGGGGDAGPHRVYVFLAGHGLRTMEVGGNLFQTCFVAHNFRPAASNSADGLVPCTSFRRSLRNERFDEVLLFLDCCRNEFPITSLRALPLCDLANDRDRPQWSVGHATKDSGLAHETTTPPYRGAFTKTLVTGLRTCRDERTGLLTVDRLDLYVRENIQHDTASGQVPYFDFAPPDAPLVLATGMPAIPKQPGPLVDLAALPTGSLVILKDGANRIVPDVDPLVADADAVQLPPLSDGLYSLEPADQPDRATLFKQPRDRHVIVV